ncbi:MAG: DUF4394 domain-containing protein [Thermodesulfobacteriota bacterium]
MSRRAFSFALGALLATTVAAQPARAQSCGQRAKLGGGPQLQIVGLTGDGRLVRFGECNPRRPMRELGFVTGLVAPDTRLVGIDFRVQTGALYGVGDAGGVYVFVDPRSPAALKISQLTIPLDPAATAFGVDFNPAADRLRIVSDTGQDLRHNVNEGGTTIADGTLNYLVGTPPAPQTALGVTGAAYTNNDLDPSTATTLLDVDGTMDQVAIQSPPNAGTLFATGKLGVDAGEPIGFDVYSTLQGGVAVRNAGFASLSVGGVRGFYRVDLLSGRAVLIGALGDDVVDIAIPLDQ